MSFMTNIRKERLENELWEMVKKGEIVVKYKAGENKPYFRARQNESIQQTAGAQTCAPGKQLGAS